MKRKFLFLFVCVAALFLWLDTGVASAEATAAIQTSTESTAPWTSILPPLIAIGIALTFRQVLLALFLGIWSGALLAMGMSFENFFISFFTALSDYIVPATADESHMSIIIFTLLIGGMVGIITDNGGTRGVIKAITRFVPGIWPRT